MKKLATTLFCFICFYGYSQSYKAKDKVSIEEKGIWYPGYIMEVKGDQYKIHYDNYDPKYDCWVGTSRLKSLDGNKQIGSATPAASGTYNKGDIVEYFYRDKWVEAEVVSPISSAGRYQVKFGTLYEYAYPKELRPTNKENANIERDKQAEQKRKDDEVKAKQDAEDQVGVIGNDKLPQWNKDVEFAYNAVGQLCYYLDNHPNTAPGFDPDKLSETLKTLEQLDKLIKEKYPNAKSGKWINRNTDQYLFQPGVYREVAEQRKILAKRALAAAIQQQLTHSGYDFEAEFNKMKSDKWNTYTIFCHHFMEYAYFPAVYSKYKNNIRVQYEKAYKDVGIEFKDDEVFIEQNKQLAQLKKYVEENIGNYTMTKKKAQTNLKDMDAEAVALKGFKLEHPEATVLYIGFTGNYITATDDKYSPPRILGKGKGGRILAKVPNIPYIVSYYFPIEQNYTGGKYGPTQLGGGGKSKPFTFDGFVNEK